MHNSKMVAVFASLMVLATIGLSLWAGADGMGFLCGYGTGSVAVAGLFAVAQRRIEERDAERRKRARLARAAKREALRAYPMPVRPRTLAEDQNEREYQAYLALRNGDR